MSSKKESLRKLILAGMFLALAMILPFITGQFQQIGNTLCPMHFPVILCGYFCGPFYAFIVGLIAPLLRFLLFGMPPIFPTGIAMCVELSIYGFSSALLYKLLPKKKIYIYISLILCMIIGRLAWGLVMSVINSFGNIDFGFNVFITNGFLNAVPGIVLQIIIIPILVITLNKYTLQK